MCIRDSTETIEATKFQDFVDAALQVFAGRHEWIDVLRGQSGTLLATLLIIVVRPGQYCPRPHNDWNYPLHRNLHPLPGLSRNVLLSVSLDSPGLSTRCCGSSGQAELVQVKGAIPLTFGLDRVKGSDPFDVTPLMHWWLITRNNRFEHLESGLTVRVETKV